jgi:superfamily II DNA or RNA helicase
MLAHPVTEHFALVGTAFDYLLRFEVQRRFPKAKSHRWVAEEAVDMIRWDPDRDSRAARRVLGQAKRAHREFIRARSPSREALEALAGHALRLAKLDQFYRAATLDLTFEEASPRDVRDLLRLLSIVPFDGPFGGLLAHGPILLNPTFGKLSHKMGGADADLVAGGCLIDFKVTKFPKLTDENIAQVVGYSMLADLARTGNKRAFPELGEVGLYFARHAVLQTIELGPVRQRAEYAATCAALLAAAKAPSRGQMSEGISARAPRGSSGRQADTPGPLLLPHEAAQRGRAGVVFGNAQKGRVGTSPGSSAEGNAAPVDPDPGPHSGSGLPLVVPTEETKVAAEPVAQPALERSAPGSDRLPAVELEVAPIKVDVRAIHGPLGQVVDGVTPYHAKYFAHEITRLAPGGNIDRISQSLFDACVDLQPHQIEAGLFALKSPISKGVMLADEVGLGKTIEAGLVLCQFWAERKRRLLVICPASIRKQWQQELAQKFNLPSAVLDSREAEILRKRGHAQPFIQDKVVVVSYHYANRMKDQVQGIPWVLVVLDEAHHLRNARTQASQNLRAALRPVKKLLLTATPLQNNLGELYTLSSFIDEHTFGDRESFQLQFSTKEQDLAQLRQRLAPMVKRTLRKDVLEYIRYTQRHPITVTFDPDAPENTLYQEVSEFLQRDDTYSLPPRQRHLMVLLLRKILASSSTALAATLDRMQKRLIALDKGNKPEEMDALLEDEAVDEEETEEFGEEEEPTPPTPLDKVRLKLEIEELGQFVELARSIKVDSKTKALLRGLGQGFERMRELGGPRKALVFTESKRTQQYLRQFLEANGYAGQIVLFNGTNSEPESKAIYEEWKGVNEPLGRATGNRNIDQRTSLIEYFRDKATIMLATEAAGEGVNLQFCSLVVNYDLPWNPQRIEQRIGRCHRYGQKHDVVVVNFLNTKNEADKRVLELLSDKFHLFKGVFGSSDEVLGTLESGVDFERKILAIYQTCRTSQAIDRSFDELQKEMEHQIKARMQKVRQALLEHFDEEVHTRFRNFMSETQTHLSRVEDMFWRTTKQVLDGRAKFHDKKREFDLEQPPLSGIRKGPYRLISRSATGQVQDEDGEILCRLSHPLGEYVLEHSRGASTPLAHVTFRITGHPTRIMVLEKLKKQSGWLTLTKLGIRSLGEEEHLIFTGFTDSGEVVPQETFERMFSLPAAAQAQDGLPRDAMDRLSAEAELGVRAQLTKTMRANTAHFDQEQERIEHWAEDRKASAHQAVEDLETQIRDVRRRSRQATTLRERLDLKEDERRLISRQKDAQQRVFNAFDEIRAEMDSFVSELEKQLGQDVRAESMFTIRWSVA